MNVQSRLLPVIFSPVHLTSTTVNLQNQHTIDHMRTQNVHMMDLTDGLQLSFVIRNVLRISPDLVSRLMQASLRQDWDTIGWLWRRFDASKAISSH